MADFRRKVEIWFESVAGILYRNPLKTLFIMLVFIAALLSQVPKITTDISTEGFLHKSDPALLDYNGFRDQFGRDELIIIAVSPPDVFDRKFLKKLKALHDELEENVPFTDDITSLINARNTRGQADELIVEDLLENWPETPEEIAVIKKRVFDNPIYLNTMISEDGKLTTILIKTQTYSSAGDDTDVLEGFEEDSPNQAETEYLTDRENTQAVNAVHSIIKKYNAPDFQTWLAGSAVVTHFLKQSMMKNMRKFVLLALIVISVFLFVMFPSDKSAVICYYLIIFNGF
ncbi:MAG: hypothetical protein GY795_30415 [Desulfobacterales bacterium]|nr:hypothetical protein [Desulfobacterales bacterium]